MGGIAKPTLLTATAGALRDERGVGLVVALLALIIMSILGTSVWVTVDLGAKSSTNREGALEARLMAEAGQAHAQALLDGALQDVAFTDLLRGTDGVPDTPDDGYLIGHGLQTVLAIPPPPIGRNLGNGKYYVQVLDDPADPNGDPLTDGNDRVLLRAIGEMPDGASATIDVVVSRVELGTVGLSANGSLEIKGNAELIGECQGVHTNSSLSLEGNPVIEGPVTASGTVEYDATRPPQDPDGNPVQPQEGMPTRPVPDYDPLDVCSSAEYVLHEDGTAENVKTGQTSNGSDLGWRYRGGGSTVTWETNRQNPSEGTYCVHANAELKGNVGQGENPVSVSVIATGSIKVSGTPYITAAHDDGILLLAGGDVSASGNAQGSGEEINYAGSIYARSQCELGGNARFQSNVQCKDDPDPPGARNLADENRVHGNPKLVYDECDDVPPTWVRRITSWNQRFGN